MEKYLNLSLIILYSLVMQDNKCLLPKCSMATYMLEILWSALQEIKTTGNISKSERNMALKNEI